MTKKDRTQILNKDFMNASAAMNKIRNYKNELDEFFYNDVSGTLSQYNDVQLKQIKDTFNIPVATKFAYAIIEQMISFLIAAKPMPRYIGANDNLSDWAETYEKAFHAMWYENRGLDQIKFTLRDALNTGEGYLYFEKNNYFNESTTNVVMRKLSWKNVLTDPETTEWDNSDARYMIIIDAMRRKKAEQKYDVKISKDAATTELWSSYADVFNDHLNLMYDWTNSKEQKDDYVWIRKYFYKEEVTLYIDEEGRVSTERPEEKQIPNPEKAILLAQIKELDAQIKQASDMIVQKEMQSEQFDKAQVQEGIAQLEEQFNAMMIEYKRLPSTVTAYELIITQFDKDSKEVEKKITALDVTKIKQKRVKTYTMAGDKMIEEKYLPIDEFPIINLNFNDNGSPMKRPGMTHFIQDIVKAMNKYISSLMYNISVNGHRRGFIWENTVVDESQLEDNSPNSFVKLRAIPDLPDGGKPIIDDPPNLIGNYNYMLDYFKFLIEYITGITGLLKGDPEQAPTSFGVTQSMQTFGTMRIKMYARTLEKFYERVAYIAALYLQHYAPRNTIIKYFDDDDDQQEIAIMDDTEDLRFKVRVSLTNELPTLRQLDAQLLALVSSNTKDPQVSGFLTQQLLSIMDSGKGKQWAEEIDQIKQMQQQLQQAQEQIDTLTNQNKSLTNNMQQTQVKQKVDSEAMKAEKDIAVEKAKATEEENEEDYVF